MICLLSSVSRSLTFKVIVDIFWLISTMSIIVLHLLSFVSWSMYEFWTDIIQSIAPCNLNFLTGLRKVFDFQFVQLSCWIEWYFSRSLNIELILFLFTNVCVNVYICVCVFKTIKFPLRIVFADVLFFSSGYRTLHMKTFTDNLGSRWIFFYRV